VQTDVELSEIIMRAFILRRLELIAHGIGDAVLVGSAHSPGTLRIKEFLTRNGHPYKFVDLDNDPDSQEMLDQFRISAGDIPVVICRGSVVLRNPTIQQVADCLGLNPTIDRTAVCDVVIIGAGHNGLTCAAYLGMAGLKVKVLERRAIVGGAAVTEEFHPGFRNSVAAYAVSLLNPKVIADLRLFDHGLKIVERRAQNFLPALDGSYLLMAQEHTESNIAKFSESIAPSPRPLNARIPAVKLAASLMLVS